MEHQTILTGIEIVIDMGTDATNISNWRLKVLVK